MIGAYLGVYLLPLCNTARSTSATDDVQLVFFVEGRHEAPDCMLSISSSVLTGPCVHALRNSLAPRVKASPPRERNLS